MDQREGGGRRQRSGSSLVRSPSAGVRTRVRAFYVYLDEPHRAPVHGRNAWSPVRQSGGN